MFNIIAMLIVIGDHLKDLVKIYGFAGMFRYRDTP